MEQFQTEASVEEPRTGKQARQFLLDVFETVVISILLFVAINAVSARIGVDGHSMVPTFQDGEFVIVDKISYSFKDPERGDIVVYNSVNPVEFSLGVMLIKRVIGIPGDHIQFTKQQLYRNGLLVDEPYINTLSARSPWSVLQPLRRWFLRFPSGRSLPSPRCSGSQEQSRCGGQGSWPTPAPCELERRDRVGCRHSESITFIQCRLTTRSTGPAGSWPRLA